MNRSNIWEIENSMENMQSEIRMQRAKQSNIFYFVTSLLDTYLISTIPYQINFAKPVHFRRRWELEG